MSAPEFSGTRLILPSGAVRARWLGEIGDTGMVHIRYWKIDPATKRNSPVTLSARYCQIHCVLYLPSDYPSCPECGEANIVKNALLSK